jgi:hypothetical protein
MIENEIKKLLKKKKIYLKRHKELWRWLVKNPDKEKHDWPGWVWNGGKYGRILNDCWCCKWAEAYEYTEYILSAVSKEMCDYCPIVFPGGNCEAGLCQNDKLFDLWRDEKEDMGKRKKLALRILNLPERKVIPRRKR